MAEHTRGPWHATKCSNRGSGWVIYGDHWEGRDGERSAPAIANTTLGIMNVDREDEEAASARLMAASPDMLETLQNIENDDEHMPSTAWAMIQAAIAKATGADSPEDRYRDAAQPVRRA